MLKLLRKLLLIDFVLNLIRSKQNPHVRFSGFLQVFAFLWLALGILLILSGFSADSRSVNEWMVLAGWIVCCGGFFFLYRHTSKILKGYTEEEATQFAYLRYLNPVAPVIYFTTFFLVVLGVLNVLMLFLMIMGTLLFFLGILVTFGLLLMDKTYKLDNFISLPKAFFNAEEYFLEHIISPWVIILFLVLIYFVIPVGASSSILWQHSKRNKNTRN